MVIALHARIVVPPGLYVVVVRIEDVAIIREFLSKCFWQMDSMVLRITEVSRRNLVVFHLEVK